MINTLIYQVFNMNGYATRAVYNLEQMHFRFIEIRLPVFFHHFLLFLLTTIIINLQVNCITLLSCP